MDISNMNNIKDVSSYASSLASAQNTAKLSENAKKAQSEEEMMDACKEFESYLWEQVIKEMKKSAEVFSSEEDKNNIQLDYFMDGAISETAKTLTEQSMGPNSLAMQMFEQMKRNAGGLSLAEVLEKQEQQGNPAAAAGNSVEDGDS